MSSFSWTRFPRPPTHINNDDGHCYSRKRDRDEDGPSFTMDEDEGNFVDEISAGDNSTNATTTYSRRRNKRIRREGPDLVPFAAPFMCAFLDRPGGCRFQATCSYHHGSATRCDCDDASCPCGHPNRRAPHRCDHGAPHQCRWNSIGECSFHHGVPIPCDCHDLGCRKAHLQRVVRQKELRGERKTKELQKENSEWAQSNARKLFVGHIPPGISERELRACFHIAFCMASGNDHSTFEPVVVDVRIYSEQRFGFVEFRNALFATVCLALNGLSVLGKGRIVVDRPMDYDPSQTPPNSDAALPFDTSGLDIVAPPAKRGAKKKKKKKSGEKKQPKKKKEGKKTGHYHMWRGAQHTGETNAQKRKRYLELFPEMIHHGGLIIDVAPEPVIKSEYT